MTIGKLMALKMLMDGRLDAMTVEQFKRHVLLHNRGVAGSTAEQILRDIEAKKPVCTAEQPAPKGEPIFPGARYAHTARKDWRHPDVDVSEFITSGGLYEDPEHPIKDAYMPVEHRQCRHCGGNL